MMAKVLKLKATLVGCDFRPNVVTAMVTVRRSVDRRRWMFNYVALAVVTFLRTAWFLSVLHALRIRGPKWYNRIARSLILIT